MLGSARHGRARASCNQGYSLLRLATFYRHYHEMSDLVGRSRGVHCGSGPGICVDEKVSNVTAPIREAISLQAAV